MIVMSTHQFSNFALENDSRHDDWSYYFRGYRVCLEWTIDTEIHSLSWLTNYAHKTINRVYHRTVRKASFRIIISYYIFLHSTVIMLKTSSGHFKKNLCLSDDAFIGWQIWSFSCLLFFVAEAGNNEWVGRCNDWGSTLCFVIDTLGNCWRDRLDTNTLRSSLYVLIRAYNRVLFWSI